MNDLEEGHEILKHAARLGPKVGMAYLSGRFASGTTSVSGFLKAVRSYTNPDTGELSRGGSRKPHQIKHISRSVHARPALRSGNRHREVQGGPGLVGRGDWIANGVDQRR